MNYPHKKRLGIGILHSSETREQVLPFIEGIPKEEANLIICTILSKTALVKDKYSIIITALKPFEKAKTTYNNWTWECLEHPPNEILSNFTAEEAAKIKASVKNRRGYDAWRHAIQQCPTVPVSFDQWLNKCYDINFRLEVMINAVEPKLRQIMNNCTYCDTKNTLSDRTDSCGCTQTVSRTCFQNCGTSTLSSAIINTPESETSINCSNLSRAVDKCTHSHEGIEPAKTGMGLLCCFRKNDTSLSSYTKVEASGISTFEHSDCKRDVHDVKGFRDNEKMEDDFRTDDSRSNINRLMELPQRKYNTRGASQKNMTSIEMREPKMWTHRDIDEVDEAIGWQQNQTKTKNENWLSPNLLHQMSRDENTDPAVHESSLNSEEKDAWSDTDGDMSDGLPNVFSNDEHKNVFERKKMNILLIGQTGAGKTTFTNAFKNYLHRNEFNKLLHKNTKFEILADVNFTETDQRYKSYPVSIKAPGENSTEYYGEKGQSVTQAPRTYELDWNDGSVQRTIRLIDTPGVNDSRGTEKDKENFSMVMDHISQNETLDAIIIVLKPNENKLSSGFRYCMHSLLTKLHLNAAKNIIFCLSMCSSPGDTLTTLGVYLEELRKTMGVELKADHSNVFCYNNRCFRYLCAVRAHPRLRNQNDDEECEEDYEQNVKTTIRLLDTIKMMTPHLMEDSANIHRAREIVETLSQPCAESVRLITENKKIIQEEIKTLNKLVASRQPLTQMLISKRIISEVIPLKSPKVICKGPRCAKWETNRETLVLEPHYNVCYEQNSLVSKVKYFLDRFGDCVDAVQGMQGGCKNCKCLWKFHDVINYDIKNRVINVRDRNAEKILRKYQNKTEATNKLIEEKLNEASHLEQGLQCLLVCCAEYTAFIEVSSLQKSADPFAQYLLNLLREEKSKAHLGGDSSMFHELSRRLSEYEKQVREIVQQIHEGRRTVLSGRQLNARIETLQKLPRCGKMIREVVLSHTNQGMEVERCATTGKELMRI